MTVETPRRILVVGSRGREHAITWKLAAESAVEAVLVVPGSAAIAAEPGVETIDVPATAIDEIVDLARQQSIDLVVVGPEAPLAAGLADQLDAAGIPVFGASRAASAIEWSKAFCHDVATAAGVRMADAQVCRSRAGAQAAIDRLRASDGGFVVKDDGLADGKGVTVFGPGATAEADLPRLLDALYGPGSPERTIVVEERLHGPEASVIAVCDGSRAIGLPAARDHKRLGDGDAGPNTGGMGAYSPLPDLDDADVDGVLAGIHEPILRELAARGSPFRGFLYAGLILTATGPVLLECNARLGDPEAQVILPRVDAALGPILLAAAGGALPADLGTRLPVRPGAAVGIVIATGGYPAEGRVGLPITGIDAALRRGALVFHAATIEAADGWATNGGRVLTVVGLGPDLIAARVEAEGAADLIAFQGSQRRHDIGQALGAVEPQAVI